MLLSQGLQSRANNYNLIRLTAAFAVLFSHAFTVVTGDGANEPMRGRLGLTPGSVAVDVFFVVSGLLVTQSMRRSDSALDFIAARLLRIWPGLVVSLVVTGAIASMVFASTVVPSDALGYVARNALPFGHLRSAIAGIFPGNPAGPGFNASLWTLPIEVRMYRDILVLWLVSFVFMRHRRRAFEVMVVLVAAWFAVRHLVMLPRVSIEEAPDRLPYMFFAGAAALVLAPRIVLDARIALVAAAVLVAAAFASRGAFFVAYGLVLWYLVFGLAYLVGGRVLRFNRFGDYSYGVYVYAWPVQQLAIAMVPGITVAGHLLLTVPVVLALAMLSWHLVESPALRLKRSVRPRTHPVEDAVRLAVLRRPGGPSK